MDERSSCRRSDLDPRCQVVALAGSDPVRTAELARQSGIPEAFGNWTEMIERADIDAVAIATPPGLQPEIAIAALKHGKPVFVEKPMAADLAGRGRHAATGPLHPDDDGFQLHRGHGLAKGEGATGRWRDRAAAACDVNWNVENASTRLRMKNWKTSGR